MITVERLNEMIQKIFSMNVQGHPEERFLDVFKFRKDQIKNHSGMWLLSEMTAWYIAIMHAYSGLYSSTHSTNCELLVNKDKFLCIHVSVLHVHVYLP